MEWHLHRPPFPPLSADDDDQYFWCAEGVRFPQLWSEPARLVVHTDPAGAGGPNPPTAGQEAAFTRLLGPCEPLWQAVLTQFRWLVPPLAGADWGGLEAFFALDDVRLLGAERDGLSYVGLVFSCIQYDYGYEHGAGVVVHADRVVWFGVAEVAGDETEALVDLGVMPREPDDGG